MGNGMIRRVDELGRVVLPVELRRELDIGERDLVEVRLEGEELRIRKMTARCVFCGGESDLLTFCGRCVCRVCREQLCTAED